MTVIRPPTDDVEFGVYDQWFGQGGATWQTELTWADGLPFGAFDEISLTLSGNEDQALYHADIVDPLGACVVRSYAVHSVSLDIGAPSAPWVGSGWAFFADGDLYRWRATLLPDPELELPVDIEERWLELIAAEGVFVLATPPAMLWSFEGTWTEGDLRVYAHPTQAESNQPSFLAATGTYGPPE